MVQRHRMLFGLTFAVAAIASSSVRAGYNQDFSATFPAPVRPGTITVIMTNESDETIVPFLDYEIQGLNNYAGRHQVAARTGGANANQEVSEIVSEYTVGANTSTVVYPISPLPETGGNGVYEPDAGVLNDGFITLSEDGIGDIQSAVAWDEQYNAAYDSAVHSFSFRISGFGEPVNDQADGLGWSYLNTANHTETGVIGPGTSEEPNFAGSVGVGFDIWDNGGEGGNSVSVHYDGTTLLSIPIDDGTSDPNTGDDWAFNSFETDEEIKTTILITPGAEQVINTELKGGAQYQIWNRGGNPPELKQKEGMDGFLRITREQAGAANVVAFDHDGSEATTDQSINFDFRGLNENGNRADGMSFLLVPIDIYDSEGAETIDFGPHEEPNLAGAFGVGFDTFNNDAAAQDEPEGMPDVGNHISIHFDNEKLLQENFELDDFNLITDDPNLWHHADIQIAGDDVVITITDGADGSEHVITETIAGLSGIGAVRPVFAARTGGAFDHYDIDNFFMNVSSNPCDFDGDGSLGLGDVNALLAAVSSGANEVSFDITADGSVNVDDIKALVTGSEKLNTWMGDANLDGEFNSGDLVAVFQAGKFETGNSAAWQEGDWNGDGVFGSGDLVAAFQDGGFELGPRGGAVASVPEPSSLVLLALGVLGLVSRRRQG